MSGDQSGPRALRAVAALILSTAISLPSRAADFFYDFGASCSTMTLVGRTIACNDGTSIVLDSGILAGCPQLALTSQPGGYTLECATPNVTGLWWRADENGRGTWVSHQGDTIFAVDYAYDALGAAQWRTLIGSRAADTSFSGTVLATGGPSFSTTTFDSSSVWSHPIGPGWIAVDDADHLRVNFADGSVRALVRQQFGPLPLCSFASATSPAASSNYTDLWWNPMEAGWGIDLAHQGDIIFAAWFTYNLDGTPLWLVTPTVKSGPGTYMGKLYRTVGPAGEQMQATEVGSATLTFADGNTATFAYSVQLAGMPAAVAGIKAITRQIFVAPGTTCR